MPFFGVPAIYSIFSGKNQTITSMVTLHTMHKGMMYAQLSCLVFFLINKRLS